METVCSCDQACGSIEPEFQDGHLTGWKGYRDIRAVLEVELAMIPNGGCRFHRRVSLVRNGNDDRLGRLNHRPAPGRLCYSAVADQRDIDAARLDVDEIFHAGRHPHG
jgi:hypothetical protein